MGMKHENQKTSKERGNFLIKASICFRCKDIKDVNLVVGGIIEDKCQKIVSNDYSNIKY